MTSPVDRGPRRVKQVPHRCGERRVVPSWLPAHSAVPTESTPARALSRTGPCTSTPPFAAGLEMVLAWGDGLSTFGHALEPLETVIWAGPLHVLLTPCQGLPARVAPPGTCAEEACDDDA